MTQPDLSYPMNRSQTDTVRLWLSDQQWLSILSRIEQGRFDVPADTAARRQSQRHATSLRCMLRIGQRDGHSATYMVHAHNLSDGGLGFVHAQPIEPQTICTIALETPARGGRILPSRIAWCQNVEGVEPPVYNVGVAFDQPIDVSDLTPLDSSAPQA